jgi:hypothetical protein
MSSPWGGVRVKPKQTRTALPNENLKTRTPNPFGNGVFGMHLTLRKLESMATLKSQRCPMWPRVCANRSGRRQMFYQRRDATYGQIDIDGAANRFRRKQITANTLVPARPSDTFAPPMRD